MKPVKTYPQGYISNHGELSLKILRFYGFLFFSLLSRKYINQKVKGQWLLNYVVLFISAFKRSCSYQTRLLSRPSLNIQSCNKELLVVQEFCFWAIWAAWTKLKNDIGPIMSNFWGCFFHALRGKTIPNFFFENIVAFPLNSCINVSYEFYFSIFLYNLFLPQDRLICTPWRSPYAGLGI